MKKKIIILGASQDPERYSYKAVVMAEKKGMEVLPVNPRYQSIDGIPVFSSLGAITDKVDYLSIYVSYAILEKMIDDIVAIQPSSVILNPGSDSPPALELLNRHALPVSQACTLVLLSTGQIP